MDRTLRHVLGRPVPAWVMQVWAGTVVAATVTLAAQFLAGRSGLPVMLVALLIGMCFNFLDGSPRTGPGLTFCSQVLLRVGVALLGLQLTFSDIAGLGVGSVVGVAGLLAATIGFGILSARAFGFPAAFGLLTGGAVAICGASAALAIAALLLPRHLSEKDVLVTVVGVTALSTVAMIAYPVLFTSLGFSEQQAGYLIGVTIHDVAQVVGAGYSIGEEAGDIATFSKLLRVAFLPLVLLVIATAFRPGNGASVRLPWFVVAFVGLMLLRNAVPLPDAGVEAMGDLSRFLFVMAISALGVKTSLGHLFRSGRGGIGLIAVQTCFLLVCALVLVGALA